MSQKQDENLFRNPDLSGPVGGHGLPQGFTLAPYEHGVHFWKLDVGVEVHVDVVPTGGPDGRAALRIVHQEFRLLDPWDDYLPKPGTVTWVGIRPELAPIAPAPVDRLFELVYWGRTRGDGYVHARISGPDFQNDPESIAWQRTWRRIEHTFILGAGETLDGVCFYVNVRERGDVVELSGFELRYVGEFKPVSLKVRPRLQHLPEPDDSTEVKVNPPTLVWPDEGESTRYEVEVSPVEDFSRDVQHFGPVNFNFFKLPGLLAAGRHFWRWRRTGGGFGPAVPFTMPEDAEEYVTPTFDRIFADLRRDHPRLFVTPETLDDFRRLVTVGHAPAWREFLTRIDEPDAWFARRRRRHHRRRNVEHEISMQCLRLEGHAFAWLVTGDRVQARKARTLLVELLDVPTEGVTQHRHSELNHAMIDQMSLAYDWLYDVLTEDERARTREAIAKRIEDIYNHYRAGASPWHTFEHFRYDSHATYMNQSILRGALAIADELPEAKRWMEYWLMASISFYPPWSETDGSWAQGTGYCSPYVDHSDVPEARLVRSAMGLDFFQKPFFRRHRDFILYSYPPFGQKAPFGDLGAKDGPHDNDLIRFARVAGALAEEYDDPYAAWYAAVATPLEGFHPLLALQAPMPKVKPKPPTDLPLAKVFPDTGWALLHTDLTGRDDVFLAFKSSPFGSMSHSHADQNSFTLSVGDRRLLTDAGYYAGYGTPHHLGFYKHTKAHNTILVDGRGQLINESKAGGHVTRFGHTDEIDYVVGDAQAAYGNLLERFDRHVVFLRPDLFVIFDDIVAAAPSTIDWLLHAPVPFEMDEGGQRLLVRNGPAFGRITLSGPGRLAFSQTDRFDPPPHENAYFPPNELYRTEYHFTARSPEPLRAQQFLAFIAVGEWGRREDVPEPVFVRTTSWQGVETAAGCAVFRTGDDERVTVLGREIETDARALVLRPSGAFLAADATFLKVDGKTVFESTEPVGTHTGRLV